MGKERLTLFFLFFKVVLQPSSGKGEPLFHVTLSQFHTTTHTVGNDSQVVCLHGRTLHAYRKETEHYPGLSTSIQLPLALVNFHSLKTPSLRNITIFSEKHAKDLSSTCSFSLHHHAAESVNQIPRTVFSCELKDGLPLHIDPNERVVHSTSNPVSQVLSSSGPLPFLPQATSALSSLGMALYCLPFTPARNAGPVCSDSQISLLFILFLLPSLLVHSGCRFSPG